MVIKKPSISFALLFVGVFLLPAAAGAAAWNVGDLAIGVSNGCYQIRDNTGALKETICDNSDGFTTGCSWNNARNKLYTTNFSLNNVVIYDDVDPHAILQTLRTGGGTNESIVFDAAGNFFVGHAGPPFPSPLEKYDAVGALLASFSPAIEDRGTDWNDLAANQSTVFYTSEGTLVKRFDVAAGVQLADFSNLGSGPSYALRLLPPGDGTGGLLVANSNRVVRLDGAGNVVRSDALDGCLFSLNLDPNGTSYWAGDFCSSNVYKVNIATGAIETAFNTGTGSSTVFGLCLKGELTAASTTPFAAFKAEVEVKTRYPKSEAEGRFTLGDASDGIDPAAENVSFQIGSFSGLIPKGAFQVHPRSGAFTFEGVIDGVPVEAEISPVARSPRTFSFDIELKGVDVAGSDKRVTVRLAIGNDSGTTSAPVEFRERD